eukprot:SAG11_NODE_48_length_20030_cov_232.459084_16_plen_153_part_00
MWLCPALALGEQGKILLPRYLYNTYSGLEPGDDLFDGAAPAAAGAAEVPTRQFFGPAAAAAVAPVGVNSPAALHLLPQPQLIAAGAVVACAAAAAASCAAIAAAAAAAVATAALATASALAAAASMVCAASSMPRCFVVVSWFRSFSRLTKT